MTITDTDRKLARERLDLALAKRRAAEREEWEAELALREITGLEDEPHTRWLRAVLANDQEAATRARVEAAAANVLRYGWRPSDDLDPDAVTAEVERIKAQGPAHAEGA